MRATDFIIKENKDIHAIAINQTIPTSGGKNIPNPNITDWVIQTVVGNINLGTIHKRTEDGKFEIDGDFGKRIFDDHGEARDFFQQQYDMMRMN